MWDKCWVEVEVVFKIWWILFYWNEVLSFGICVGVFRIEGGKEERMVKKKGGRERVIEGKREEKNFIIFWVNIM